MSGKKKKGGAERQDQALHLKVRDRRRAREVREEGLTMAIGTLTEEKIIFQRVESGRREARKTNRDETRAFVQTVAREDKVEDREGRERTVL